MKAVESMKGELLIFTTQSTDLLRFYLQLTYLHSLDCLILGVVQIQFLFW